MTAAERLYRWNCWYDQLPQEWRFQVILWPLIAVGALNMLLTIFLWFPFGLLLLIALLCLAVIRVPYVLGWIVPDGTASSGEPNAWRFEIANTDWLADLNQRYDAMPEFRGLWLVTSILLIAGTINMLLTLGTGFPFGLIFLLAILVLAALRAPYVGGFLKSPRPADELVPAVQHDPGSANALSPAIRAEPYPVRAMMPASSAPLNETPTPAPGGAVAPSGDAEAPRRPGRDDSIPASSLPADGSTPP